MPVPSTLFLVASTDICCTFCYLLHLKLPFRISSLPRGEEFRPGVYFLLEDVIAVDGNGGRPYRTNLDLRYRASPSFRKMLVKMSLFWSCSALFAATVVTVVIFEVPDVVAFGIGESISCLPLFQVFIDSGQRLVRTVYLGSCVVGGINFVGATYASR